MEYLCCRKCHTPLTFEVREIAIHNISSDGKYFIDDNFFTHSRRFEEHLFCNQCNVEFIPEIDWWRDSEGKIVLHK